MRIDAHELLVLENNGDLAMSLLAPLHPKTDFQTELRILAEDVDIDTMNARFAIQVDADETHEIINGIHRLAHTVPVPQTVKDWATSYIVGLELNITCASE